MNTISIKLSQIFFNGFLSITSRSSLFSFFDLGLRRNELSREEFQIQIQIIKAYMNLRLAPQRILLSDDTLQAVLQGAIITYGESGLEQKVIRYFSNGVGREMWKFIQYELSIILNNVFFDNIKAVISFLNENGVICSI